MPSTNFHTYGERFFFLANRQMAIVPQLSVYKRTFQSQGVGQLLWNVPLSQNRWICSGSDYSSAWAAICNLVASLYCLWNLKKASEESQRWQKKHPCPQVKACIWISHSVTSVRFSFSCIAVTATLWDVRKFLRKSGLSFWCIYGHKLSPPIFFVIKKKMQEAQSYYSIQDLAFCLSSCDYSERFVWKRSRFNQARIISQCLVMGSPKTKPAPVFTGFFRGGCLKKKREPFNQNPILCWSWSRSRSEELF